MFLFFLDDKKCLEGRHFFWGWFGGGDLEGGQDGAGAFVDGVEFDVHLGLDLDPGPGLEGGAAVILAGDAHKLDILHAAGHNEAARGKVTVALLAQLGDLGFKLDRLPGVFLRLLRNIPVEQGIVLVRDGDDGGIDIKGQRVLDLVKGGGDIGKVVDDIHPAVDSPGQLMQRHGVRALFDPVEDDHLAAGELINNEIS